MLVGSTSHLVSLHWVPLYIIATKVKVRPAGAEVLHQAKLVANERYDLHDVSASCDDEGAVGRRGDGVDGALEVELALVFDLDEPRSISEDTKCAYHEEAHEKAGTMLT